MPSAFEAIAQTVCAACGRDSDHVALKRLNAYSRAFSCLSCYIKYSNCATCQHPQHGQDRPIALRLREVGGRCFCGCTEYIHGVEAEFHRQFDVHTGKVPDLQCARGCGRYRQRQPNGFTPLWCSECEKEYAELND